MWNERSTKFNKQVKPSDLKGRRKAERRAQYHLQMNTNREIE